MGAGGLGGGGKRNANADLNLVPYIDLLSTLIAFLLVTAVWQQLEVMSTSGQNSTASDNPSPPDPDHVDLSVTLFEDRVELLAGPDKQLIPLVSGEPDQATLLIKLGEWKKKWPKRSDVVLHTDSHSPYKHLIKIMDILTEAEFKDVGVNTN